MPIPLPTPSFTEFDQQVFQALLPENHYLRLVLNVIDFERIRPTLATVYTGIGRPPIDPVLMLKFHFLRFHYKLSDRAVVLRATTDIAFRFFLGLRSTDSLPHHTDGTYFRERLGPERFNEIFHDVVTQAREHGLIHDRLRVKDATHLFANAADMTPLALASQVRTRLLNDARPLFPDWVAEQETHIAQIRQETAEWSDAELLGNRVELLRDMVGSLNEQIQNLTETERTSNSYERLQRSLAIATKMLADRDDPQAGDRLASAHDPDARTGKHGNFYVGFMLDLAMDPDSEIITSINVLPANGAEAADTVKLIRDEEEHHGNKVEGVSLDGIGYNGPVLQELMDPNGLNLEVTVPVPQTPVRTTFGPERFHLTILEDETTGKTAAKVTCPNEQETMQRKRNEKDTGWKFTFDRKQCAGCPFRNECLENPDKGSGRVVTKNDYEAEYEKVKSQAKTPEYEQTRQQHAKVERKLGEVVRHHGLRQVNFRGLGKVLIQALLTTLVVNVKRIVKLVVCKVGEKVLSGASTLGVRAEVSELVGVEV